MGDKARGLTGRFIRASPAPKGTPKPSRHEDNPTLIGDDGEPTLYGADYLTKLDKLTGVRHSRLRAGSRTSGRYVPMRGSRVIVDEPGATSPVIRSHI